MYDQITAMAKEIFERSVARRRDLHRHPETGWLEMRTSAVIAGILTELGYEVLTGSNVLDGEARLGLPSEEVLREHANLVRESWNTPLTYLTEEMEAGYTGVIGILRCGPGPVCALRFDIDALGVLEDESSGHRPAREGFASLCPGVMHACGHDGHTAIGLGVAEVLMSVKEQLHGTVKLIFQPAEEGVRGARAIVSRGHLDDVDYFIGTHLAPLDGPDDGAVTPATYGSLATTKYDVIYHGAPAHAGGFPEKGRNALLAAASAAMGLAAIPRHSEGASRVNTGTLHAGTGRNVIPDYAKMEIELRGETTAVNAYMEDSARRICEAAAAMYGCTCEMICMGAADSHHSDLALADRAAALIGRELPDIRVSSVRNVRNWGSEDISLMMNRVQSHGGQAICMRNMTRMEAPQHTADFDFDETVLEEGIRIFSAVTCDLMQDETCKDTRQRGENK
ncbi:MAG: amidohydrolase [Clostridiales bacterium]|nr:amidohydrolase [Clostridiales bacterium]